MRKVVTYSADLEKEVAVGVLRYEDDRETLVAYYRMYGMDELMRMLNLN